MSGLEPEAYELKARRSTIELHPPRPVALLTAGYTTLRVLPTRGAYTSALPLSYIVEAALGNLRALALWHVSEAAVGNLGPFTLP